jgi:hypothetical protein
MLLLRRAKLIRVLLRAAPVWRKGMSNAMHVLLHVLLLLMLLLLLLLVLRQVFVLRNSVSRGVGYILQRARRR